jgi:RNA polymerase sigma-70 factor (ECF subfamily)
VVVAVVETENRGFLRALARSLLADPERADDVVQDAWLAALKRPPRAGVPLRSWLAAVVRNRAYRVGREEARRARRERAAAQREWVRPADDVVEAEAARQEVVRALLGLEEPYRTVLLLRYYDDLKPREIAARLGLPGPTVRTRIERGLKLLRGRLDAGRSGDRRSWCLALAPLAIAPARSSVLASVVTGGIVMKTKLAAVALILAALGLFLYTRAGDRALPSRATREPMRGTTPREPGLAGNRSDPLPQPPPPVELAAVDLDLDVHGIVVRGKDGSPCRVYPLSCRSTISISPLDPAATSMVCVVCRNPGLCTTIS